MFIDGILVYIVTDKDYKHHLHIVLHTLREEQLYAKFSKCEFRLREVGSLDML